MNTLRGQFPLPEDLRVFLTVIRKSGFASAAEELGLSPAYVSKRIAVLEKVFGARLLHRTTRRIALTDDGERVLGWAQRLLGEMDDFIGEMSEARQSPRGMLHICSTFGFGRNHVAPAISRLAETYPELEIRLDVFDRVVDIIGEGFDLEIRVGDDLPNQHMSRKLVSNQRVLCATPEYLARRGVPTSLEDLADHDCLVLKERNHPFAVWTLKNGERESSIRVNARLSSNNGEIVLQWALNDAGILLRSMWDVKPLLEQGRLVQVLHDYSQSANVWAVYPIRLGHSAKLRVCVEFLENHFRHLSS
ncbi:LysR substrate-binding domain-containing protein [Pseudomonas sp.]|uniref:LysR substrate-binding domain-containing protein n=1 Tax=Pseudomonas sp. TaxID=306 RepID=UPI0028A9C503|nr:LysR substrate-binding domain-containing protein [Pseudomonas sp.]